MRALPDFVYPVAAVRDIDRAAIEDAGIPGYTLMTRAAASALEHAQESWPFVKRFLFLAGPGNNAGDAYVMARLARAEGYSVRLIALADPDSLTGDALTAAKEFLSAGGRVETFDGSLDVATDLIVDGLFGSGLARDVEGAYRTAIDVINAHGAPVLALDIPSGIAGDSGARLGTAVRADLTVAFVGLKPGYFLGDGINHTGRLVFAGLDVPDACYDNDRAVMRRVTDPEVKAALSPRPRNSHKGDFGHVVVLGGTAGMPGAALLAGEAALRAGAGKVTVATHPLHAAMLVTAVPELMVTGVESTVDVETLLERADVLAFGPGIADDDWSRVAYRAASAATLPQVWDAGALTLLAERPNAVERRIITPHPGEAARLLGWSTARVQAERLEALEALVAIAGGVAVLKGACSLVGSIGAAARVVTRGNPGMATAGMGDVLTGVIAAMLGQGLSLPDAAAIGAEVHAHAGDLAAGDEPRGLVATDVLTALKACVNP